MLEHMLNYPSSRILLPEAVLVLALAHLETFCLTDSDERVENECTIISCLSTKFNKHC